MQITRHFRAVMAGTILTALALAVPPASAADALPEVPQRAVGGNTSQSAAGILAARRYAAFWNTGDEAYAKAALAPDFIDRTLPAGRVQGVAGPLQASKFFRTAVPDLSADIVQMVVAGDRVSVQYRFRGRFSGRFGDVVGKGQAIDFMAFDIYRVHQGRIAENWHLEDNLQLMKQMGIIQ